MGIFSFLMYGSWAMLREIYRGPDIDGIDSIYMEYLTLLRLTDQGKN